MKTITFYEILITKQKINNILLIKLSLLYKNCFSNQFWRKHELPSWK